MSAQGQQRDQRISVDITGADLPVDVRIEAAARLGDRTLAVWGTSLRVSDTIVGALWSAVLDKATVVLGPRMLTSDGARPSNFVQVLRVDDRFLVAWNDARDGASGAYAVLVDTTGTQLGEEFRLGAAPLGGPGVVPYHITSGSLLLFNDTQRGVVMARRLDSGALGPGEARIVAVGAMLGLRVFRGRTGYTAIDLGSAAPVMVDTNGEVVPAPEVGTAVRHELANGSYVLVTDTSAQVFAGASDIKPQRTLRYAPDPARINGSETFVLGVDGRISGAFAFGGGRSANFGERIPLRVVLLREEADKLVAFDDRRPAVIVSNLSNCATIACTAVGAVVLPLDSSVQVFVAFRGVTDVRCGNTPGHREWRRLIRYEIHHDGRVDTSENVPMPQKSDGPEIRRVTSRTASAVQVIVGTAVQLEAPAAQSPLRIPQVQPGIRSVGGKLLVGWLVQDADTTAVLRSWYPFGGGTEWLDTANLSAVDTGRYRAAPIASSFALRQSSPSFTVVSHRSFRDVHDSLAPTHQIHEIFIPTPFGWTRAVVGDTADASGTLVSINPIYNSNLQETFVASWMQGPSGNVVTKFSVQSFDVDGKPAWKLDSVPVGPLNDAAFVPIGSNEFIVFTDTELVRIKAGSVRSVRPRFEMSSNFLPMSDDDIMTWSVISYYQQILLRLIRYDGTIFGQRDYSGLPDISNRDYCVFRNRTQAGYVGVVTSGATGLQMTTFNEFMEAVDGPRYISDSGYPARHPAVIYRADTVFIVWESERGGIPAIYGRAMARFRNVVDVSDRSATSATNLGIEAIMPNPARDRVAVHIRSSDDDLNLTLVDMMGNAVPTRGLRMHRADAARWTVMFETDGMASGVYLVRVACGGHVHTGQFVVVH